MNSETQVLMKPARDNALEANCCTTVLFLFPDGMDLLESPGAIGIATSNAKSHIWWKIWSISSSFPFSRFARIGL
jgi:hypothetical protein